MDTVDNAVLEIRGHLGEATAKHWSDDRIIGALNRAQVSIVRLMQLSAGNWLTKKSTALTPSSNQFAWPTDCGKPIMLEEVTSGDLIFINDYSVTEKLLFRYASNGLAISGLTAFIIEDYVEVNADSYTKTCYMWYTRNPTAMVSGGTPDLPDAAWDVLIWKALWTLMMKPGATLAKEFYYFVRDEKRQAEKEFDSWISTQAKASNRVTATGAYQNG